MLQSGVRADTGILRGYGIRLKQFWTGFVSGVFGMEHMPNLVAGRLSAV